MIPRETTHWDATVSAALVGVNNRRPTRLDADPVIAGHLPPDEPLPTAVLRTAALTAVARNASGPPAVEATPIGEAPADPRPELSDTAARAVHYALEAASPLRSWALHRVAGSGRRAPTGLLVPLLRAALRDTTLRADITRIVGPRGAWLAAHTPDIGWGGVLLGQLGGAAGDETAPDERLWTHGTVDQRVTYLSELRRRNPGEALRLLGDSWSSETGPDREKLLPVLAGGLSAADEPFLERCLTDRRKKVRTIAQDLLTLIPESALQQRLRVLAAPHVRLSRSLLRATLQLTTPTGEELAEADAARDGISSTAHGGGGPAGWVTAQLLRRVTLTFWEAHLGAAPEKIVGAVSRDDAGQVILALAEAAVAQRDTRWATALLNHPLAPPGLFGVADPTRIADAVITGLRNGDATGLDHLPAPWPPDVAAAAFDAIGKARTRYSALAPQARMMLTYLPIGLPLEFDWSRHRMALREAATANLWTDQLAVFDEALRIRTALERELT